MNKHCLILFTRYPVAGETKTRMIPHLGAEGAAALQRALTEHTVNTVAPLIERKQVDGVVHYTGATPEVMQAWLGEVWRYLPQCEGDLGARMTHAFREAFQAGAEKVVIIGSDCPGIDAALLLEAYKVLSVQDTVFGPAADGGYYLVGLRCEAAAKALPELFLGPDWGTGSVLATTLALVETLELSVVLLPEKQDVDRPEDLGVWEQIRDGS